jgi:hypothetical protein
VHQVQFVSEAKTLRLFRVDTTLQLKRPPSVS